MKKLIAPLVALLFVLAGCSDSTTGGMMDDRTSDPKDAQFAENEADMLGKKGDNGKGKPGGNDSEPFPTYSNIDVTPVEPGEAIGWYDDSFMTFPVEILGFEGAASAAEFFGCPFETEACYAITVTLDQAASDDMAAVRFFPFEEDSHCSGDVCPEDFALDYMSRRSLTLFDDYVGTPFVPASAFDGGTFTFYWQGQFVRPLILPDRYEYYGYYRSDRDPDDQGPDLLRAQAYFRDASSMNTVDTPQESDMYQCASANPITQNNLGCVFRHAAPAPDASIPKIRVELKSVSETTSTSGRGRNKSTTTNYDLIVETFLNETSQTRDDGLSGDIWVSYLVVNEGNKWVESTSNTAVRFNRQTPVEGCLSVRPVQAELWADNLNEFHSAFSADNDGFVKHFVVNSGGQLSEDTAGTCSSSQTG